MQKGRVMEIRFKRPELEDRDLINSYLKYSNKRSCEMTFANLYLWSGHYNTGFAVVEDMLVLGKVSGEGAFAMPAGPADTKKTLDTLMAYCEEKRMPFQLYDVTKEDFAQLEGFYPGMLEITYNRDYADYVYEAEKLRTLSGKKYHGKKNHVNKFKALYPNWSYEPITKENVEECVRFAHLWREQKGYENDGEMQAELRVTLNFLRLFQKLKMRGGVLRVNGEIAAFTVGEPAANRDTLLVHVEKALADVQGAYAMINQQFAEHEGVDFTYLNREEDVGNEGLRRSKMSYKPAFLIEKGIVRKSTDCAYEI